jgi:hypothetical protein
VFYNASQSWIPLCVGPRASEVVGDHGAGGVKSTPPLVGGGPQFGGGPGAMAAPARI